jgi:putative two-component system response regulator
MKSSKEKPRAEGKNKLRILYIDDEHLVRESLAKYLVRAGYEVIQAETGERGIEIFQHQRPDAVLVDLRMPGMGGLEVLEKVTTASSETPVVLISGAGMLQDAIEALRLGAWDFITKPIQDLALLNHTLKKVCERASLIRENREYREYLEEEVKRRTVGLRESVESLERMTEGTIDAFGRMAELRDPYTAGHQKRVSKLAYRMARILGVGEEECKGIRVAGVLHDIGKIHIPSELLNKPGGLTDLEMNLVKTHPHGGYEVLKTIAYPWPVAEVVLQHHEHFNGTGYPQGLDSKSTRLGAKIIHVADTVEAMSSHRPYRPALGMEAAVDEIKTNRGLLYCPECVDACLEALGEEDFEFD